MTWTYEVSTLATSSKDQVRLLIGDVLSTDPQMQDEEINYYLTTRSTAYGAAAECCRTLQAKFSRSVDQGAGSFTAKYSQLAKAYGIKAAEFEEKAAMVGAAVPYAGAIHISDMQTRQLNTDVAPPAFNIGMDDAGLPVPSVGTETDQPSIIDVNVLP